jgi:hypothetical protein
MLHAVTLPATFKAVLFPSLLKPGEDDPTKNPRLDYWFDPLPPGSASRVHVVLGPAPGFIADDLAESTWETVRRLRPAASEWIWPVKGGTVLDIFGPCPATKIAFGWIQDDPKRLKWV